MCKPESGAARSTLGRRRLARAWLVGLVAGLVGAWNTGVASPLLERLPEDCAFDFFGLVCSYPEPSYEIRLPARAQGSERVPVAVIYHDAGGDAADLLADEAIVDPMLESGYAVLAPQAPTRRNRRMIFKGARPSGPGGTNKLYPMRYSDRDFVIEAPDGEVRKLQWGEDTGWYFYTTDEIRYTKQGLKMGQLPEYDYIGRDEIDALQGMLADAATTFGTERTPTLVGGIGHGASVVWQVACYAPDLARWFAPIGGAFWQEIPEDCQPGARLVHTHRLANDFWPLEGTGGGRRRYLRTSVFETLDMLLRTNGCGPRGATEDSDAHGFASTAWTECRQGGPVEQLLVESREKVPEGWADAILARLFAPLAQRAQDALERPPQASPAFRKPGEMSDEAPSFSRPGITDRSGFKRAP